MVLEGRRRGQGGAPGDRRDQPAGGRARLDPRRLRDRDGHEHGARLGLAGVGRARVGCSSGRSNPSTTRARPSRQGRRAWRTLYASERGRSMAPVSGVLGWSGLRSPQRRALLERLGAVHGQADRRRSSSRAPDRRGGGRERAGARRGPPPRMESAGRGGARVRHDRRARRHDLRQARRRGAGARDVAARWAGARTRSISGLALLLPDGAAYTAVARTAVSFRALDEGLMSWYLATEEWRGRSGGYAIQGSGAGLGAAVQGEDENVVGLPLASADRARRRSCSIS